MELIARAELITKSGDAIASQDFRCQCSDGAIHSAPNLTFPDIGEPPKLFGSSLTATVTGIRVTVLAGDISPYYRSFEIGISPVTPNGGDITITWPDNLLHGADDILGLSGRTP